MRRMMDKMGLDMQEMPNVREVLIRTDKKEIILSKPEVTEMKSKDKSIFTRYCCRRMLTTSVKWNKLFHDEATYKRSKEVQADVKLPDITSIFRPYHMRGSKTIETDVTLIFLPTINTGIADGRGDTSR